MNQSPLSTSGEKRSQYGCGNNSYYISYFGFYIMIERLKKFLHLAQKSRLFALLDFANTRSYPDYKDIT
ncbi:hypothetical protein [uncultured Nostoc sp.]|uniref:hypothetical protein n=1 Tax=uncultured Nostoc sp. TaxID=340711 RepID=UPI0035C9E0CB